MDAVPETLPPLLRFTCGVVRCNPDILARAPRQDHQTVLFEALLLLLVAGITGLAWTTFWVQFLPLPFACLLGFLAFCFMFMIDQAIGAAEWAPAGILSRPGLQRGRSWWMRLSVRVLITLVLSLATSTGATMAMFHDTIAAQLDQDRREQNRQIEEHFVQKQRELRAQRLGSLPATVEKLTANVKEITTPLDQARQLRAAATNRLETNQREAERELTGAPGYRSGAGPKYLEALAQQKAAQADIAKADADIAIYAPRLADLQRKLDKATAELREAEPALQPALAQLEEERKSQMVPDRRDALLNYIALQKIYQSPVFGKGAHDFGLLMMAVLMTIELSYLGVRVWFQHASIYMVLLIADTRLRAERIAADYERESAAIRRERPGPGSPSGAPGPSSRPPLRLLRSPRSPVDPD